MIQAHYQHLHHIRQTRWPLESRLGTNHPPELDIVQHTFAKVWVY